MTLARHIRRTSAALVALLTWAAVVPAAFAAPEPMPASARVAAASTTATLPPPSVSVPAAYLSTLDGSVPMWARRPHTGRRGASTIKMLTVLVVRDRARLDDVVTVPRQAAIISDGDAGLVTGQKLTVRTLLRLTLICSANDAAEALAIHVAGSEAAFVRLMNAKAAELKLANTHATDPHGLGKRETTCASDLAVLARHVMADKELRGIVRMRSVTVRWPGGGTRTFKTTNKLLGVYPDVEGVKTGYTIPAGYCFVSAAKRGDLELVGVVMGAPSNSARFSEARRLLNWGFAHSRMRLVASPAATVASVPVAGGANSSVMVRPIRTVRLVEFDGAPLDVHVTTPPVVRAPVRKGERLGLLTVRRDGRVVERVGLFSVGGVVATEPAERSVKQGARVETTTSGWQGLEGVWKGMTTLTAN